MNKTYRLVWNELTCAWVAVAEHIRTRGKRVAGSVVLAATGVIAVQAAPTLAAPANSPATTQLPTGGQVVAGQASVAQSGATMNITQTSQRAAIDWQTFNVGSQAQVNFIQPSSSAAILNRVLDPNPSQIFGRITSNGQVFLTNPSGIYFSPSASVNVGAFTATTHSISNDDFMAGNLRFTREGATGSVENEGTLTADLNGYIALLAPEVRNSGVVIAQMGTVALAAGEAYELQFDGNSRLSNVRIEPATLQALVENRNAVQAPGGLIILSAQAANHLQGGVVNNSGALEATGLVDNGGTIRLEASDRISHTGSINVDAAPGKVGAGGTATLIASLSNPDSVTEVSGSISARGGDLGGDGGFVETSASRVRIGDNTRVDTRALAGQSGNWLIDPTDYTVAASGGDITGATLSTNLGGGNVTLQSSSGASGSSGNININDSVSWSANTLTLNAQNNININSVLNGSGTAGLALQYGQGAVAAGNSSTYNVNAAVNLASTGSFSTKLGSDGSVKNYTIITSLGAQGSVSGTDLQGMSGNLSGNYVLGANLDASATSGWNAGAGFLPIGTFTGLFDGLGHTISSLTINRADTNTIGLFGAVSANSVIRNIGLLNASIIGRSQVGSLVAYNEGTVSNSYATGSANGIERVGGLVGRNEGGSVSNSHAQVSIGCTAVGCSNAFGGLVGWNNLGGSISNSYATGNLSALTDPSLGWFVGGLVGANFGTVSDSFATGNVEGRDKVGGLIGWQDAGHTTSHSYATGTVTNIGSNGITGGLVGQNDGAISYSYATGNVSGTRVTGGLVGLNKGTTNASITNSYATGDVTGSTDNAGGLTGNNEGTCTISNSYALGNVSSRNYAGGLSGQNYGTITNSYAVGTVTISATSGRQIGGLMSNVSGTVTNSYWNTTTSGLSTSAGGTGLTTTQMQTATNFSGFTFTTTPGATGNNWVMVNTAGGLNSGTGATLPMLASEYSTAISNAHQLQLIAMDRSASYTLAQNINAAATGTTMDVWHRSTFIPVSSNSTPFTGSFDGGGHTISGLTLANLDSAWAWSTGLFGNIGSNATVQNVGLVGGSVAASGNVGGLVGENNGIIRNSYNTGTVSGSNNVGGLVGINAGTVSSSYATGAITVTGGVRAGGLVGSNYQHGDIRDSYATGAVTGADQVGGLVGGQETSGNATIRNSYATGVVSGSSNVGGLLGKNFDNTVTNSFFSAENNPSLPGIASGDSTTGATGKTNAELKTRTTYPASWDFTSTNSQVWNIDSAVNGGYPFLCGINGGCVVQQGTTPIYLRLIAGSSYYGQTPSLSYAFYDATSGGNVISDANPSGTVTWSTSLSATSNAGTYSETYGSGITLGNAAYSLSAGNAVNWIINPAPLTVTASTASKTYDGQAYSGGNGVSYSGFVNNETSGVLGGTLGYGGTSQGATNAGSYVITPAGLTSGNYSLSFRNGRLTINASPPPPAHTPKNPAPPANNAPALTLQTTPVLDAPSVVRHLPPKPQAQTSTMVALVTPPSSVGQGVVTVVVPKTEARVGSSFSFSLPEQVVAGGANNASIDVKTANGDPMPAWLRFDPKEKTFSASSVPDGAFPLKVIVTVGTQQSVVIISDGS